MNEPKATRFSVEKFDSIADTDLAFDYLCDCLDEAFDTRRIKDKIRIELNEIDPVRFVTTVQDLLGINGTPQFFGKYEAVLHTSNHSVLVTTITRTLSLKLSHLAKVSC